MVHHLSAEAPGRVATRTTLLAPQAHRVAPLLVGGQAVGPALLLRKPSAELLRLVPAYLDDGVIVAAVLDLEAVESLVPPRAIDAFLRLLGVFFVVLVARLVDAEQHLRSRHRHEFHSEAVGGGVLLVFGKWSRCRHTRRHDEVQTGHLAGGDALLDLRDDLAHLHRFVELLLTGQLGLQLHQLPVVGRMQGLHRLRHRREALGPLGVIDALVAAQLGEGLRDLGSAPLAEALDLGLGSEHVLEVAALHGLGPALLQIARVELDEVLERLEGHHEATFVVELERTEGGFLRMAGATRKHQYKTHHQRAQKPTEGEEAGCGHRADRVSSPGPERSDGKSCKKTF